MPNKTISRNRKSYIRFLLANAENCQVYTLDNYFKGRAVDPDQILSVLFDQRGGQNTRLYLDTEGESFSLFTVHVHSNLWYTFRVLTATVKLPDNPAFFYSKDINLTVN